MDSLKVVLEYRRSRPAWVCLECDTENDCMRNNCLFCGCNRTGNEWQIDAWKPNTEKVVYTDKTVRTNSSTGGTIRGTSTGSAGSGRATVPVPETKSNSGLVGFVVGAALLLVVLFIILVASGKF